MEPTKAPDDPNIALVTHEFTPFRGGAAVLVREVAARLAGHGAEVWAPDYSKSQAAIDAAEAFRTIRWRNGGTLAPWNILRLARDLARTLPQRRPHRLALMGVGAIKAGLLLRWLRPGRLPASIVAGHFGSEVLKLRAGAFWRQQLQRAYAAGWDACCAGEHVESLFRAVGWAPPTMPIGQLTCALPEPVRQRALATPGRVSAEDGSFRLLTLARFHPRKGQLEVAKSFRFLPADVRAHLRWIVAGAGHAAYRAQVLAEARSHGIAVEDRGAPDDDEAAALYRECSAYVMASVTLPDSIEGFGITYLEAGAFGLPVIGSRTGGVAEAIAENVTGLLVPESDPEALAAAITLLATDRTLAERLGRAGRERALASSWESAAKALLAEGRLKSQEPRAKP